MSPVPERIGRGDAHSRPDAAEDRPEGGAELRTRPQLARRVALAGAVAASLSGALAALVAGVVGGQQVTELEDRTVLAATHELAEEVWEELHDDADDDVDDDDDILYDAAGRPILASVLSHELEDVKLPGATAAIVGDGRLHAGDQTLPEVPVGRCRTRAALDVPQRVCAEALGDGRVVLLGVSAEDERARWVLMAWALFGGALFGMAIGGVASYRSIRWALAPLGEVRARLLRVDVDVPDPEVLRPEADYAELEDVRSAAEHVVTRLVASLGHAQAFAAQAAHELRTPLAVLAGELELMLESARERDDPQAEEHDRELERLHTTVRGLIALTQRLLVLARPSAPLSADGEVVDLSDVVLEVRTGLDAAARERVELECDDDVLIRGAPELLHALIQNALDNALKFSSETVLLRVRGGERAVIDVIDAGPGVSQADRERVFDPFYRAPQAGSAGVPGHGVGLALIAHVARAHGGRAYFVPSDRGAHLRIELRTP